MTNIEYKETSVIGVKEFENEYLKRKWITRFNRTATKLRKLGIFKNNVIPYTKQTLDNPNKIDYYLQVIKLT